jgi:hypothetical protein
MFETCRESTGDDQHADSDNDLGATPHEGSPQAELYGNAVAELRITHSSGATSFAKAP